MRKTRIIAALAVAVLASTTLTACNYGHPGHHRPPHGDHGHDGHRGDGNWDGGRDDHH